MDKNLRTRQRLSMYRDWSLWRCQSDGSAKVPRNIPTGWQPTLTASICGSLETSCAEVKRVLFKDFLSRVSIKQLLTGRVILKYNK
jgi:hypothetical protein